MANEREASQGNARHGAIFELEGNDVFASEIKAQRQFDIKQERGQVEISVDKGRWVGILNAHDEPVAMDDSGAGKVTFTLPRGRYRACTDGSIKSVRSSADAVPDPVIAGSLEVVTDAPDVHVVDGIGEVPADGKSHCTFNVTRVDANGEPMKSSDTVYLRTTGGMLKASAAANAKAIRQLQLKSGKGKFVLVSDQQPRLVQVTLLAEGLEPRHVPVEFVPA